MYLSRGSPIRQKKHSKQATNEEGGGREGKERVHMLAYLCIKEVVLFVIICTSS